MPLHQTGSPALREDEIDALFELEEERQQRISATISDMIAVMQQAGFIRAVDILAITSSLLAGAIAECAETATDPLAAVDELAAGAMRIISREARQTLLDERRPN